jgi:ankyrin repeat protein
LREHPDIDQLKRQAKELLRGFKAAEERVVKEVNAHYDNANPATFALHDAQLVIARAYGFQSWPKLKAYVDGITLKQLVDAVRADDLVEVRALLKVRPELAHMSMDNLQVLHHAVLNRAPEMVRILMQHGAHARDGVYPHRDATSSLTIAAERGYDDIVAIINEEEQKRRSSTPPEAPPPRLPPLDLAAHRSSAENFEDFRKLASSLLGEGAVMTAAAAVALGDANWLRERHAAGDLTNAIEHSGGLLRIAASHNRSEILELLLDLGFDPNERTRFIGGDEDIVVFTWGMPLWHCAASGKYDMAEMLLRHGADPNADVYASGTPLYQAYGCRDWKMVELLRRYGGQPNATIAGLYRQTELARQLIAGTVANKPGDMFESKPIGEELLWAGACGGDVEVVRMALSLVDWPRQDPRWFGILEQPLRIWNHGSGHWANHDLDRTTYVTCFRLILERCDPNVRGRTTDQDQFGLTILHSVAGSREHVLPEERVAFATALLDAGARTDLRDYLLKSTPLGWACRWGRTELVKLLLDRGADPTEPDAEAWATPRAWAQKMGHRDVLRLLYPDEMRNEK